MIDYSLKHNYPNPFNPSTCIQYSIKVPGLVKLQAYDQFIMENSKNYPISLLCRLLEVNRAAYYHWHKDRAKQERENDAQLLSMIREHHHGSHGVYGLLRITHGIKRSGIVVNKKRVYRLMKANGIYSRTKKKFRVTTVQAKGAITETFFSSFKKELVYLTKFRTKEQARLEIFKYIESFYNRQRLHSAIDYKTPDEFEEEYFRKERNKEKIIINNNRIVDYLYV